MAKRIVVAIDGPAGAGKSTIARRLADKLGFLYIDTGAMYRAVALWARRLSVDLADMHRLEQLAAQANIEFTAGSNRVLLNGEDVSETIRAPEIAEAASRVSAVPGVRRALVVRQRAIAEKNSVLMEGRDIGTVVFPDALVKIFLDADPKVRAGRRVKDIGGAEDDVARAIRERDARDRNRAESPLLQAPDAVYIDSTRLSVDEVEQAILRVIRERTSNGKEVSS